MSQIPICKQIFQPVANPELFYVSYDSILFIGELHLYDIQGCKAICIFQKNKLMICESVRPEAGHYITEGNTKMVEFCFDLKFQFLTQKNSGISNNIIGVKFIKNSYNDFCLYFTQKLDEKNKIAKILKTYLVQRGFHQFFKPIRKLGTGSFATVFEVKRFQDNKLFAVKAFSKNQLFSSPKGKESLIKELDVLRSLNHKNILKLYGVHQSDNSIYVLLQLIRGGNLLSYLKKTDSSQVSSQQIFGFMKGLLEGLQHVHENRIMHRDLKHENIILRDGNIYDPVIVDFGLGTFCDLEEYLFFRCGTPGYIAPQIIVLRDNKTHVEPICDVFSAGAIFHILASGRPLFDGVTFDEVYQQNKRAQITLNEQEIKFKTNSIYAYDLMTKMLEKNPFNRISVLEALNHPFFTSSNQTLMSPKTIYGQEKFLASKLLNF